MTIENCQHCGGTHYGSIACPFLSNPEGLMCSDCPPVGYPTDSTRCEACPRRVLASVSQQSTTEPK